MTSPSPQQFRMRRLQVYNWGTFSDLHNVEIAEQGFLFVGHSGSGKSTLLDAISALTIPPRWASFNAAAAEADRTGRDRSPVSYVRGAWAEQKDEASGEIAMRYLRTGTTWSALALTYMNGLGHTVVLVRLFWIRGASNSNGDVRNHFLIFEHPFDLQRLKGFDLDIRKLKQSFPDAFERAEFRPYCERFRRLLGIDSEMALRLLHKTQSAKNLGDLNVLLRDFMLDRPETFEAADRLVNEFAELNAAHQSVVTAREQVQTLMPARENDQRLQEEIRRKSELLELRAGVDAYREQQRITLLQESISHHRVQAEAEEGEISRHEEHFNFDRAVLNDLEQQHRDLGGDRIEAWQNDKNALELQVAARSRRLDQARQACGKLRCSLPSTPQSFAERVEEARLELERWPIQRDKAREILFAITERRNQAERGFAAANREIAALRRHPSNIPTEMQDLRASIARALHLPESALPYVGELIEVDPREAAWRGSIERALRGFALSVLVEERHYSAVSGHLNTVRLPHQRLVYHRMTSQELRAPRPLAANSLVHKLQIQSGHHAGWLEDELKQRFDYACVESLQAFRNTDRAITREGQIRHGKSRHEKDDRRDIDDPRNWVLGFNTQEKLERFTREVHELAAQIADLTQQINILNDEESERADRTRACQTLVDMQWQEIDVSPLLDRIHDLSQQIEEARANNAPLRALSERITQQKQKVAESEGRLGEAKLAKQGIEREMDAAERKLAELKANPGVLVALTPLQVAGLEARFALLGASVTLDSLDELARRVERAIGTDIETVGTACRTLQNAIEAAFREFKARWPLEAGDMDGSIRSTPDFLARLHRLETDGLPAYEQRFFELLRTQSHENLAALSTHLHHAHKAIGERMELVNKSLNHAEFNPGTFLKIDVIDRQLQDVREFKQGIEQALRHAWSDQPENAETRFVVLRQLVERLGSLDPEQVKWREAMLDVRQHVEFIARETDARGNDLEIYRSGSGKSGGQRQKLATTCLAAALRYQLGSDDQRVALCAPVVLDEAFEKADSEFTTLAMNVFVKFGFQMIVATPLKSVMTLEPFIGGACFIEIRDRRHSAVLPIEYDTERSRLRLPQHIHQDVAVETP